MHANPCTLAALAVLLMACQSRSEGGERLPALGATPNDVTVSGISAGGYMAGQFHVAHSRIVTGAGIIAAGPYLCAQGSMRTALGPCVKGGIALPPLLEATRAAAARGAIDRLDDLRGDRVWLFHGAADSAVDAKVVTSARDFYAAFVTPANVAFVDDVPVTHGLPTLKTGGECNKMLRPYLNACNYDAAGAMLESLRGELAAPVEARGRLLEFDQTEFGDAGLNPTGRVYVPSACRTGQACSVHVFFHGCDQSSEVVGDAVARGAGFNQWAESNRLVILYPQARASSIAPLNPLGCWDWWGYSGEEYATRAGKQIRAVKAMIDRVTKL